MRNDDFKISFEEVRLALYLNYNNITLSYAESHSAGGRSASHVCVLANDR